MAIVEYNKGERAKTTTSDEDEPSFTEGGVDGHGELVSYMSEDTAAECSNGGRKYAIMQKKGKWKLHLLPDPSLQRSLQLALRSREDDEMLDTRKNQQDNVGNGDQDADSDDHDDEPEEK
ncbi:hypothetical protein IFM89_028002 [Coptis chinensis]|uniref:Uncharacterized protein n=1 Tax=Coptis chinensis TaxID=261450 RepID=A0A835HP74_9MAGN|nr:hypothetical protein IFM89_028002 [Coptis chinensis]